MSEFLFGDKAWFYRSSYANSRVLVCSSPLLADPSGRAVWAVGLRSFACYDCGFESSRGHGCLSLLSVVYCQVEACASG
jgi:hypothetical protein